MLIFIRNKNDCAHFFEVPFFPEWCSIAIKHESLRVFLSQKDPTALSIFSSNPLIPEPSFSMESLPWTVFLSSVVNEFCSTSSLISGGAADGHRATLSHHCHGLHGIHITPAPKFAILLCNLFALHVYIIIRCLTSDHREKRDKHSVVRRDDKCVRIL